MKIYKIWSEGWSATGGSSGALLHGTQIANSFREACNIFFSKKENDERGDYDSKYLTYWGCSLFDNEKDARRSFG